MSDEQGRKYEKEFGLDMTMDEALRRFVRVTKDEIGTTDEASGHVPQGEMELVPFKKETIRRVCHGDTWWYSVIDVVGALTGTDRARKYWFDLKRQLLEKEGASQLSDEIGQLPLPSPDGKMRQTDVATAETILRIIQSISSPKAEPLKRWLAKVGYERIQEGQDPEVLIKRAIMHYQVQGRDNDWIEKRVRSIVARKELTSEWQRRGIQEGVEYAMLTNIMSEQTFGVHTAGHKRHKGLSPSHVLRDHMTDLELILTMLSETSTKEIAKQRDAQGFGPNARAATDGGAIAGSARKQIENQTGQKVVSQKNFLGDAKRVADPVKLTKPR